MKLGIPLLACIILLASCNTGQRYEPMNGEFDLSHPAVQEKIRERWGGPPPPDQIVISPAVMFESELLETVFEQ